MRSDAGDVVDFAYLEGYLAGDMSVVLDVLGMFREQARGWLARLDSPGEDLSALAHTIKGAARGVGARATGEAADAVEFGGPQHLPALKEALKAAIDEIAAYQAQKGA